MKKRIGTKLYDTETALSIIPDRGLYKQGKHQTYFLYDGQEITPLKFDEAERIMTAAGYQNITQRKPTRGGFASLHVSAAAADHLAAYCRGHGVTQKSVIEEFIYSLPLFNKDAADRDRQEVDRPEN